MKSKTANAVQSAIHTVRVARPEPEDLSEWLRDGYQELRRVAAHYFNNERPDHTLQTTELLHETFVRLAEHGPEKYASRAHFFGVFARAMRQILVEHARKYRARKRAGAWQRVPLEEADLVGVEGLDFIALDEALNRLNSFDSRLARIVELRFFGGLTTGEVAAAMRRGKSTIRKDWRIARAWLLREMQSTCD